MNPRLEFLTRTSRHTATKITNGSELVRLELVRLMEEANINRNQTARLLGASYSSVSAWLTKERKCPLFLQGCINFARLQCGLQVEITPPLRSRHGRDPA